MGESQPTKDVWDFINFLNTMYKLVITYDITNQKEKL